jgi:hypothetical protein
MSAFPREVCEAALAHALNTTEAAYRRSSALEKRRQLMEAWARYINGDDQATNVVPLHAGIKGA